MTLTLITMMLSYPSLEILVAALDAFSKEAMPLGLEVTCTKIQDFGSLLKEPTQLVHTCLAAGVMNSQQGYLEMLCRSTKLMCFQSPDTGSFTLCK